MQKQCGRKAESTNRYVSTSTLRIYFRLALGLTLRHSKCILDAIDAQLPLLENSSTLDRTVNLAEQ